MKRLSVIFVCLLASVTLALTPAERRIVEDARGKLQEATTQFQQVNAKLGDAGRQIEEANKHAAESDARAAAAEIHVANADQHAAETAAAAKKTGEEIETAHKNEQRLGDLVKIMQPIYDQVYKYWGIGAIILGFKILAKHLLILAAVLIGVGLALWVASFFFPVIGVGFKVVRRITSSGVAKVATLIHRDKPTS